MLIEEQIGKLILKKSQKQLIMFRRKIFEKKKARKQCKNDKFEFIKKKIDEIFELQRLIFSFDLYIIYVNYTESISRYYIF